jgi:Asp-tRNA(Asn)/Glu-tRNA(Gln) amidotransferase A subunit family amidase
MPSAIADVDALDSRQGLYHPSNFKALTFHDHVSRFREGRETPRDYLERCLARIAAVEPRVKGFVHLLDLDAARREADSSTQRYRAGRPLSPIDGIPIGVKDLYSTANMPTQMGSPIYEAYQSQTDCAAVAGLRAAGAIVIGKTVTTEFGFYHPGPTRNPFDLERTPGGSSTGSGAVVGARMIPAAIAGQAMGSLLRPASFCGVVGFKPGLGILNRGGSPGAALSHAVMGVMAGSVEDAWAVTYHVSARAGSDVGYQSLVGPQVLRAGLRPSRLIRLAAAGWDIASAGAREAFDDCVGHLRSQGVEVIDSSHDRRIRQFEDSIADARNIGDVICGYELRWKLNEYEIRFPGMLSANIRARLQDWNRTTPQEYWQAIERRAAARKCHDAVRGIADGLIGLAALGAAPKGLQGTGDPVFAVPSSILGAPAFSLPVLMDEALPLGLQCLGFPGHEEHLARCSKWIMDTFTQPGSSGVD